MSDQNYIALNLQMAGHDAMPSVLQLLRDSKLSELCYAYKIRTKPEQKLLEKVQRKIQSKPEYCLADITDVVGLRLVALFKAEMVDIFEGVLTAITHKNGIKPNPFVKAIPEEVILYKGANAFDELSPRLKEVVARLCPQIQIKEEHSKEGYSSVHLVARLNTEPQHPPKTGYKVPIEIQIRSVFEDAWGEIDHKYGYVIRSGKDAGKPINNPEFVLGHLKVLKRFTDACMEYADQIRTEAVGVPPSLLATRKVVSVPSDNQILERFVTLGLPKELVEQYCRARDLKDSATKTVDQGMYEEGKQTYLNAAELFRDMAEDLDSAEANFKDSEGSKLFYYYLRMNEALCLMSTNERDQVVVAQTVYLSLEGTYPEFPLLKMRHGQALGKLGHVDESIIKLREAGLMAEAIASGCSSLKIENWPDLLPFADYDHIIRTQPKLLGYHIWLKIRSLSSNEEKQKEDLFEEAYNITKSALQAVADNQKQALSLHNNLLYYASAKLSRVLPF